MKTAAPDNRIRETGDCLWQEFVIPYRYRVAFTRNVFSSHNRVLADSVSLSEGPAAIFPVVDQGVADADPDLASRLEEYAAAHPAELQLVSGLHVLPGGEQCKEGAQQVEKLHRLFLEHQLCRHSFILAIGGGAFLDVVGYSAATAHRGIRLIRLPTTTLAQNDAGVGVKNGYNAFGRKNWVGSFSPPFAVINDFDFIRTLPPRHCRAGMAEAVKVALIKDAALFCFLSNERNALARFEWEQMEKMIIRCAHLHLQHIAAGDPFEQGSMRPLDFGHWSAHALEESSRGEILHGEAVAIGMALDSHYAWQKGLLTEGERDAIINLLQDLGFTLVHPALALIDLGESLDRFRQHLGGRLSITMPVGIGNSKELREMDLPLLQRSREWLLKLPLRGNHGANPETIRSPAA